ncbi:MAG: homoserine kinase [Vicinamibacterales bacterium]|jgi:homoserine kinase|nr:homoserine kinase [Acidobacteriota bacterium]MDP7210805.1 homoserine kinase [Vicinamibacterales bacterium]HJO17069.1 homoserine kinase [Vicinamibacterales bacterium]|tara:strand:- start:70431 stop:71390 length:960 start_codon:yes stop_codon:yes gene_type:complete
MPNRVRVFAPSSASNLGPGFDVLGLALLKPGDIVEAELSETPGVEIAEITGDGGALPRDPQKNVASVAAADVLRRLDGLEAEEPHRRGVRLWLHKQMPLASGLGSSGASAVGGAVAVNELFDAPLSRYDLVASALVGERAASETPHADNVAPSLLGGIVLVRSYDPLELINLPVPKELRVVVVHPHCSVPTAAARELTAERTYALDDVVANLGNIAALVDALHRGDLTQFGRSILDRLVEPVRAHLIPGLADVKNAALSKAALGCSVSGSGPSMVAFAESERDAQAIGDAMQDAFRNSAGLKSDVYLGPINREGARRLA